MFILCCGLTLCGFGKEGVRAGSCAACVQCPDVSAGSPFATGQSLGATGLCHVVALVVGAIFGIILLVTVLAIVVCIIVYFTSC